MVQRFTGTNNHRASGGSSSNGAGALLAKKNAHTITPTRTPTNNNNNNTNKTPKTWSQSPVKRKQPRAAAILHKYNGKGSSPLRRGALFGIDDSEEMQQAANHVSNNNAEFISHRHASSGGPVDLDETPLSETQDDDDDFEQQQQLQPQWQQLKDTSNHKHNRSATSASAFGPVDLDETPSSSESTAEDELMGLQTNPNFSDDEDEEEDGKKDYNHNDVASPKPNRHTTHHSSCQVTCNTAYDDPNLSTVQEQYEAQLQRNSTAVTPKKNNAKKRSQDQQQLQHQLLNISQEEAEEFHKINVLLLNPTYGQVNDDDPSMSMMMQEQFEMQLQLPNNTTSHQTSQLILPEELETIMMVSKSAFSSSPQNKYLEQARNEWAQSIIRSHHSAYYATNNHSSNATMRQQRQQQQQLDTYTPPAAEQYKGPVDLDDTIETTSSGGLVRLKDEKKEAKAKKYGPVDLDDTIESTSSGGLVLLKDKEKKRDSSGPVDLDETVETTPEGSMASSSSRNARPVIDLDDTVESTLDGLAILPNEHYGPVDLDDTVDTTQSGGLVIRNPTLIRESLQRSQNISELSTSLLVPETENAIQPRPYAGPIDLDVTQEPSFLSNSSEGPRYSNPVDIKDESFILRSQNVDGDSKASAVTLKRQCAYEKCAPDNLATAEDITNMEQFGPSFFRHRRQVKQGEKLFPEEVYSDSLDQELDDSMAWSKNESFAHSRGSAASTAKVKNVSDQGTGSKAIDMEATTTVVLQHVISKDTNQEEVANSSSTPSPAFASSIPEKDDTCVKKSKVLVIGTPVGQEVECKLNKSVSSEASFAADKSDVVAPGTVISSNVDASARPKQSNASFYQIQSEKVGSDATGPPSQSSINHHFQSERVDLDAAIAKATANIKAKQGQKPACSSGYPPPLYPGRLSRLDVVFEEPISRRSDKKYRGPVDLDVAIDTSDFEGTDTSDEAASHNKKSPLEASTMHEADDHSQVSDLENAEYSAINVTGFDEVFPNSESSPNAAAAKPVRLRPNPKDVPSRSPASKDCIENTVPSAPVTPVAPKQSSIIDSASSLPCEKTPIAPEFKFRSFFKSPKQLQRQLEIQKQRQDSSISAFPVRSATTERFLQKAHIPDTAATAIQSIWRSYDCRECYHIFLADVVLIQSVIRRWLVSRAMEIGKGCVDMVLSAEKDRRLILNEELLMERTRKSSELSKEKNLNSTHSDLDKATDINTYRTNTHRTNTHRHGGTKELLGSPSSKYAQPGFQKFHKIRFKQKLNPCPDTGTTKRNASKDEDETADFVFGTDDSLRDSYVISESKIGADLHRESFERATGFDNELVLTVKDGAKEQTDGNQGGECTVLEIQRFKKLFNDLPVDRSAEKSRSTDEETLTSSAAGDMVVTQENYAMVMSELHQCFKQAAEKSQKNPYLENTGDLNVDRIKRQIKECLVEATKAREKKDLDKLAEEIQKLQQAVLTLKAAEMAIDDYGTDRPHETEEAPSTDSASASTGTVSTLTDDKVNTSSASAEKSVHAKSVESSFSEIVRDRKVLPDDSISTMHLQELSCTSDDARVDSLIEEVQEQLFLNNSAENASTPKMKNRSTRPAFSVPHTARQVAPFTPILSLAQFKAKSKVMEQIRLLKETRVQSRSNGPSLRFHHTGSLNPMVKRPAFLNRRFPVASYEKRPSPKKDSPQSVPEIHQKEPKQSSNVENFYQNAPSQISNAEKPLTSERLDDGYYFEADFRLDDSCYFEADFCHVEAQTSNMQNQTPIDENFFVADFSQLEPPKPSDEGPSTSTKKDNTNPNSFNGVKEEVALTSLSAVKAWDVRPNPKLVPDTVDFMLEAEALARRKVQDEEMMVNYLMTGLMAPSPNQSSESDQVGMAITGLANSNSCSTSGIRVEELFPDNATCTSNVGAPRKKWESSVRHSSQNDDSGSSPDPHFDHLVGALVREGEGSLSRSGDPSLLLEAADSSFSSAPDPSLELHESNNESSASSPQKAVPDGSVVVETVGFEDDFSVVDDHQNEKSRATPLKPKSPIKDSPCVSTKKATTAGQPSSHHRPKGKTIAPTSSSSMEAGSLNPLEGTFTAFRDLVSGTWNIPTIFNVKSEISELTDISIAEAMSVEWTLEDKPASGCTKSNSNMLGGQEGMHPIAEDTFGERGTPASTKSKSKTKNEHTARTPGRSPAGVDEIHGDHVEDDAGTVVTLESSVDNYGSHEEESSFGNARRSLDATEEKAMVERNSPALVKSYNLVRSHTPDRIKRKIRARNQNKPTATKKRSLTAGSEKEGDGTMIATPGKSNYLGLGIDPDEAEV